MRKVALDEGVPEPLSVFLPNHYVQSVRQLGLKGVKNGRLLDAIQAAGFDVLITNDKRMEAEQQLHKRRFAILILSACNWPVIKPHAEKISAAVDASRPCTVTNVECGVFQRARTGKPPSGRR